MVITGIVFAVLYLRRVGSSSIDGLLSLEEDCSVTYGLFDAPIQCNSGHDLYRYTNVNREWNAGSSCSTCQCAAYEGGCNASEKCEEELGSDPLNPKNQMYDSGPQCCLGWNGTQCDLCTTVDVCPPRIVMNESGANISIPAQSCSSGTVVPTSHEEAMIGKKFSCTCGGGGDALSIKHCGDQGNYKNMDGSDASPVTRFDWTFFGRGTKDNPGSIDLAM